jgi:hypothetical protein
MGFAEVEMLGYGGQVGLFDPVRLQKGDRRCNALIVVQIVSGDRSGDRSGDWDLMGLARVHCRELAENLPRICQNPAENLPRTCREFAKNLTNLAQFSDRPWKNSTRFLQSCAASPKKHRLIAFSRNSLRRFRQALVFLPQLASD